ncbi:MAG TPA: lytic transglycosylase domain-containing protein, partial [Candidatus Eisenbacteria bacterium]|nr:lytic transglycosylase domain-containing protein [Candidatus Eisenbacteria bacterium]
MRTPHMMFLVITGLFGCAPAVVDKHPPPAASTPSPASPEARAPASTERAVLPPESAELDQDAERRLLDQHPQNVNQAAALIDAWTTARAITRLETLRDQAPDPEPWWRESDLKHAHVETWKQTFRTSQERSLRHWIEDASPYAPHVRDVLREEGLPEELWVLTLLESGFRPEARSHQAAVGPWQFLGATARHTGLIMTAERDQRRDWEDATRAACRYLQELHGEFGNGLLALAAFNCGPGRVHRALAQTKKRSFWALDLPRETERYVPRALALISLVGNGENDPFRMDPDDALEYDLVTLPHSVSIESLAGVCDATPADLKKLNPSWLRNVTPKDGHPVVARVP